MTTDVQVAAPAATGPGAPAPGGPALGTAPTSPAPVAAPAAPVAPAAAAPAPVAPPAEPAKPAETGPVFEATGNPALDLALEFVGNMGLGPEHPAIKAAEEGNFALLEAALGALGDKAKGWERYTALAKGAWEQVKQAAEAKAAEQKKVVTDAVGGDEAWTKIQAWAAANAEPAEKEAVNTALAAGGIAAKAMAQYLKNLYEAAPGTTVTPKPAVPEQANSTPAGAEPMTRQAYNKAVSELYARKGGRIDGTPEYAALQAQRAAAVKRGL
jgi:hypothetical protein